MVIPFLVFALSVFVSRQALGAYVFVLVVTAIMLGMYASRTTGLVGSIDQESGTITILRTSGSNNEGGQEFDIDDLAALRFL